jgi:hypothetical protein
MLAKSWHDATTIVQNTRTPMRVITTMSHITSYRNIPIEQQEDLAHLAAQAHGLYLRLRDRLGTDADYYPVVKHAYARYRRRVAHLHPSITRQ